MKEGYVGKELEIGGSKTEPELRVPLVPEEEITRPASKPILDIDETQLKKDLEKLLGKAREAGATEVTIIPTDKIVVDERARLKCCIPLCFGYNTSPCCPPRRRL
ncbi:MAG: hypothetical protein DDT33_00854 [Firmicutes bacterium]|nr:hypothetical protein [Bacillota bacterium]